jgi:magnesium-dependent phosphatase 1
MAGMLFVFDLDFTLWDAGGIWCDQTMPPYRNQNSHIVDAEGRMIVLYPEVRVILDKLSEKGIPMALASRTHSPDIARRLLELFGISGHFTFQQIYPGSKVRHFHYLQRDSGIPYEMMYFFDDEHRNVEEVKSLGVNARRVASGLRWSEIREFQELTVIIGL